MSMVINPAPVLPAESDCKYVLFAGYRLGPEWPYKFIFYHTTVWSGQYDWPEWLPYIDVKTHAPAVAPVHTRWPIRVGKTEPEYRTAPGARVSAIFTNDPVVRQMLFKRGWVDVSDLYRAALARHRAGPVPVAPPGPGLVETVADKAVEIAARVLPRRTRTPAPQAS